MPIRDEFDEFTNAFALATTLRQKANNATAGIIDPERFLLYEAIFLRIFRAYENLLENTFISYLTGEQTLGGRQISSHVTPISREHARAIIASSQPFLDWTSPQFVIKRAETYIIGAEPIKTAISSNQSHLTQAKKIRNHIAHNSLESAKEFKPVLVHFLLTAPLNPMSAGEFLASTPTSGPSARKEILSFFLDKLKDTAGAMVT